MFNYIALIAVPIIVAIDQLTKILVYNNLRPIGTYPLIEGVFHFTYVKNTGAAFGILKDSRWVFILFSLIFIAVLLYVLLSKKITHKLFVIASVLVVSGGIGNLIDRIFRGYVIDFLDFRLINFAVFNFADSCITIGTALLFIYFVFFSDKKEGQGDNLGTAKLQDSSCKCGDAD